MTAGSRLPEAAAPGAAVFEIERFEWAAPDRIEIAGSWSGVRGRRFIRPTLVLKGEGEPKRLLAMLEHKPWAADGGGDVWVAAFPWQGEPVEFESADLHVASGIDVELPAPRLERGTPEPFPRRAAAREAAGGAVKPDAAPAEDTAAPTEPDHAADGGRTPTAPDPAETVRAELQAAHADVERLRAERDGFRRERDAALEQLRKVRGDFERERQTHERALADARAEERGAATKMLAEGAKMRATLERQREIAYRDRDDAKEARDEAVAACSEALVVRDDAEDARKQAEHDRKNAFAERDRAIKARQRAEEDRHKALQARADAERKRDEAVKRRDEILRVHERGLPIHPPKPRFLPETEQRRGRSDLERWVPRGAAIGLLLLFAFIVFRLVVGG
jgi:hypothetical protein